MSASVLMQRLEASADRMVTWFEHDAFGRRFLDGRITASQYAGFLVQSYHYVRWTTPLLKAASEQLWSDRALLAEAFAAKAREESGHDRWILRDLRALGVGAAAVTTIPLSRGVEAYVAWNRMIAGSQLAVGLLGTAYVLERASDRVAGRIAEGLVSHSGIAGIAGAVSFLAGHGEADPGHVAELRGAIERHVCETEEELVALTGELTALSYLDLVSPATAPAPGLLVRGGNA